MKFPEERKRVFTKAMEIVGVTQVGDGFCIEILLEEYPEKKKQLEDLIDPFRMYFCAEYFNKVKSEYKYFALVKQILKQQGFQVETRMKKMKRNGLVKPYRFYKVL